MLKKLLAVVLTLAAITVIVFTALNKPTGLWHPLSHKNVSDTAVMVIDSTTVSAEPTDSTLVTK